MDTNYNLRVLLNILIFILIITGFYILITNFSINNYTISETNSGLQQHIPSNFINSLEKNINDLKNEIGSLKSKIDNTSNSDDGHNSNKLTFNKPQTIDINMRTNKNNITIYDPIANYDILKLTDPLVDPRGRSSADQIPTPQVAAQLNFPTQGIIDRYHRIGLLIAIDSNYNDSDNYSKDDYQKINSNNRKTHTLIDNNIQHPIHPVVKNDVKHDKIIETENVDNVSNTETSSIEGFSSGNYYSDDNNILELIGKKVNNNWYKYFTSISNGNKVIKIVVRNRNRRELYSGDEVYIPELKKRYRVKIDEMDMIEYNPYLF
jgi:hypothetical protein